MFYCQNGEKYMVTQALRKMGLRRERLKIDWEGARILLNSKESVLTHDTENHGHTLAIRLEYKKGT